MNLCAAVMLCASTLAAPAPSRSKVEHPKPSDPIIGVDKAKHFFIAGFVETMTFAGLESVGGSRSSARSGAIAKTASVSMGREIHDRKTKGLFSVRDLAWDAIGAGAAMLVINKTR